MKRYIFAAGTAVLAAASCSIDENKLEQPYEEGTRITLSGQTSLDTKVSIGEKDGETYPLLWATGDVIRISTKGAAAATDETPAPAGTFSNEAAELFGESAGSTSGVFQTTNALNTDEAMDLVITYPGTAVYSEGVLTSAIPVFQTQRSANSSIHVGNYALAYDNDVKLEAGQTEGVTFSLEQKTAFVKVIVSTSEYSTYNLTEVTMYSEGAGLAGNVSVDTETGELTVTDPSDKVGAKISRPSLFSDTQEVYFTAIPCDLTGKDVYITVKMQNPNGPETVTVPVKVDGGKLEASKLSVIKLTGISSSSVEWEWYDPVETRDLVDKWAYGRQNTFFIEVKPSGEEPDHLKIDVKARGDISMVKEPKYYGLLSPSDYNGRQVIYLPNNVTAYQSKPTNMVNADYTIDVYSNDQSKNVSSWGVVAIYDEDYNILWSFMIWKYLTGDEPKDVKYPVGDIVLMDRILGAKWSYRYAIKEKDGELDPTYAYFQWGRKDPFMWSNAGQEHFNKQLTPAGTSLADVIAKPYMFNAYVNAGGVNSLGDWQTEEHPTDLWGGSVVSAEGGYDESVTGHKTVFDPCPEGYRVPDPKVFAEVRRSGVRWEYPNGSSGQDAQLKENPHLFNEDSPFYSKSQAVIAYPLGNGEYDYWPYAGVHYGNNANWGNRTPSNENYGAVYWSNCLSTNTNSGVAMEYCYSSTVYNSRYAGVRAQGFTVRCQKDTENR